MWECVCARARVVCHCAYWDDVSRCRRNVNLRSRRKQVDTRRAHVRLFTPMKEIFKCIEPSEHLENDTLLLLTHAPALIISTIIIARPHLMLLIIIACKENDYVIAKVINFVVDSPARKMKAKNKRML